MRSRRTRLALGLALVFLVTAVLAGAVATSAAITIELSDGDGCETGGATDVRTTATPENVTAFAGNVTKCLAGTDETDSTPTGLPSGTR